MEFSPNTRFEEIFTWSYVRTKGDRKKKKLNLSNGSKPVPSYRDVNTSGTFFFEQNDWKKHQLVVYRNKFKYISKREY